MCSELQGVKLPSWYLGKSEESKLTWGQQKIVKHVANVAASDPFGFAWRSCIALFCLHGPANGRPEEFSTAYTEFPGSTRLCKQAL